MQHAVQFYFYRHYFSLILISNYKFNAKSSDHRRSMVVKKQIKLS